MKRIHALNFVLLLVFFFISHQSDLFSMIIVRCTPMCLLTRQIEKSCLEYWINLCLDYQKRMNYFCSDHDMFVQDLSVLCKWRTVVNFRSTCFICPAKLVVVAADQEWRFFSIDVLDFLIVSVLFMKIIVQIEFV